MEERGEMVIKGRGEAIGGEVQKFGEIKHRQERERGRKVKEFVLSIFSLRTLLVYLENIVPTYIRAPFDPFRLTICCFDLLLWITFPHVLEISCVDQILSSLFLC